MFLHSVPNSAGATVSSLGSVLFPGRKSGRAYRSILVHLQVSHISFFSCDRTNLNEPQQPRVCAWGRRAEITAPASTTSIVVWVVTLLRIRNRCVTC